MFGAFESGGAINFLNFITKELLVYLKKDLNIEHSEITLSGHSLGGYFTLFTALYLGESSPFNNYIGASPSLYWADFYLEELEAEKRELNRGMQKGLYLTMRTLDMVEMNLLFNSFTHSLNSGEYENLNFKYSILENRSHMKTFSRTFRDGINFFEEINY